VACYCRTGSRSRGTFSLGDSDLSFNVLFGEGDPVSAIVDHAVSPISHDFSLRSDTRVSAHECDPNKSHG